MPNTKYRNVMIQDIVIGSEAHGGRGFCTLILFGDDWLEQVGVPFDAETVDSLIDVCGAPHLLACKNRCIRALIERGKVTGLMHIIVDSCVLNLEMH